MNTISKIASAALLMALLGGCSAKNSSDLFNLSPEVWYAHIIDDIKSGNLKDADNHYTSFSSEHVGSPMLEQATLIMAQAHINEENYAQANFYLDRYIKRFGTSNKIEYAQFLKIKANYDSFIRPNRNQVLMQDSIKEIHNFLNRYPNTIYKPLLETMLVKFNLAEYELNKEIKDLYTRTGRDDSAKVYKKRLEESKLQDANLIPAKTPWYRAPFE